MTPRSCALGCGLWLVVMALPVLALWLATQRELSWSRGPGGLVQDRVFLVDEPDAAGLGYLTARVARDDTATGGPVCVRTQVAYLLWRNLAAEDPSAVFCQCYTQAGNGTLELAATTCPGE
jgi:hypothetical protein